MHTAADSAAGRPVLIVYDGDCDFCSAYTKLLQLQESTGPVELLSARAEDVRIRHFQQQGYDLNEGMLVVTATQIHTGPDAMHWLALHGVYATRLGQWQAALFRRRWCARAIYPLLRRLRLIWLVLRGRSLIPPNR